MAAASSVISVSEVATNSLKAKVALVTGASRGIGRAIALELACNGATVAVNYNSDLVNAEEVAAGIRAMGSECSLVQGDVACKEDAHRVVGSALDQFKRLDILVNNAGTTRDHILRKMIDEDWESAISVNLNKTYYCTMAALPAMIEQKYGRIINIVPTVSETGAYGQAIYAASRDGIIAFTKCIALEYARHNITANSIAPGYTATEMVGVMPREVLEKICAKVPLRRLAEPEEIAKAVVFLARDADYMTGSTINLNGGLEMF